MNILKQFTHAIILLSILSFTAACGETIEEKEVHSEISQGKIAEESDDEGS